MIAAAIGCGRRRPIQYLTAALGVADPGRHEPAGRASTGVTNVLVVTELPLGDRTMTGTTGLRMSVSRLPSSTDAFGGIPRRGSGRADELADVDQCSGAWLKSAGPGKPRDPRRRWVDQSTVSKQRADQAPPCSGMDRTACRASLTGRPGRAGCANIRQVGAVAEHLGASPPPRESPSRPHASGRASRFLPGDRTRDRIHLIRMDLASLVGWQFRGRGAQGCLDLAQDLRTRRTALIGQNGDHGGGRCVHSVTVVC